MATVRAKEPFSFDADGYSHNVAAGALFDSDDPTVRKRAHLFEAVEVAAARRAAAISTAEASETATSAPGERRSRSTRVSSKPHPKADDGPKDVA